MDAEILEQETGRRQDGGAKRRQIMEGARTVFLSAGFDGASMNDIARAAGVSKGTLYAYFTSKDQLFEAIIRAEYAQSAERLCTFRREGDPRSMLTDFGVRLMRPDGRAQPYVARARRHRSGGEVSLMSAAHSTNPVRSSARPAWRPNFARSRPRARSSCPIRNAPPGTSSISA